MKKLLTSALALIMIAAMTVAGSALPASMAIGGLTAPSFVTVAPEDYKADRSTDLSDGKKAESEIALLSDSSLPSKYSSVDKGIVTGIKNQGSYGCCWTFASAALAETSILAAGRTVDGGKQATAKNLDISEMQLGYFTYHAASDPLGNTDKDGITLRGGAPWLDIGGNLYNTTFSLMGWRGAAPESAVPFSTAGNNMTLTSNLSYSANIAHLQNAYWIPLDETDAVKEAITEFGAVSISYMHDDAYMNNRTGGYYCPKELTTNHAITVVGWDDNYKRSNFLKNPGADGAWLVKNSWGSNWGLDGYCWISYYDKSTVDQNAIVFDFYDSDNYDYNYQYDGGQILTMIYLPSGHSYANTFTVKGSDMEVLKAAAIGLHSANVRFSLQVYKNSPVNNPSAGTAMLSEPLEGITGPTGYYTFDLDEEVLLNRGDTYSIVFTLYSADGSEVYIMGDTPYDDGGSLIYNAYTDKNQSFYGLVSGGYSYWNDLYNNKFTLRIKGYTQAVGTVASDAPESFSVSQSTVRLGHKSEFTITPVAGARLPDEIRITSDGVENKDFTYDSTTGTVEITSPGKVNIITAVFNRYTLTVNNVLMDSYQAGSTVPLKCDKPFYINAGGLGYRFDRWETDSNIEIANRMSPETTFTMGDGDVSVTSSYYIVGDVNRNGVVSVADVASLKRILVGMLPVNMAGDIDGDKRVTVADVNYLKKILVGTYLPRK